MTDAAKGEELRYIELAGHRVAAARHQAAEHNHQIVVMAHGFKSSKIGPSRYFVDLARALAERGIATFRFDQPGSGDSEGSFEDSSFNTWVETIEHAVRMLEDEGSRVALLGQSMGGRAALAAATRWGDFIAGLALWSPAPLLAVDYSAGEGDWAEEEGQRVRWEFWQEAAAVDFLDLYSRLAVPAYIIYGTSDAMISVEEMQTVANARREGDQIRIIEGLPHSAWPTPQREEILRETADKLVSWLTTG
jgi:alpha-beta hydrolase superfamily lysophospholipase